MALLEINNLYQSFGGLAAIHDLSLEVADKEILGIIGPNGAGKTTLFNIITGFLHPTQGSIVFEGDEITGLKPHRIARKGIARTFQAATVFMQSTVLDNILTGFYLSYSQPEWKAFRHISSNSEEERMIRQRAQELMAFTGLSSEEGKVAENLSSGYKKLLAIGVALTTNPNLLLLDEPVSTLSQDRVEMVMELVTRVRDEGTTVVLIEHNMKAIMDYCDRIVVIAYGRNIAEGLPQEIRENKVVIEAYLGEMG